MEPNEEKENGKSKPPDFGVEPTTRERDSFGEKETPQTNENSLSAKIEESNTKNRQDKDQIFIANETLDFGEHTLLEINAIL